MNQKLRVKNLRDYVIGINLKDFNNRYIPLSPNGVALLTEEELMHILNTSSIFEDGDLRVENKEALSDMVYLPDSPNALSDRDLLEILKLNQSQLSKAIEPITSKFLINRLKDLAIEANKSVKFVEVIENKLQELF